MNDLDKSILKTLAFFDIFKYPLTDSEIFKWLYNPDKKYQLSDIRCALNQSPVLRSQLSVNEAFYSLKGRDHIYLRRKQNNNLAERKFRRAVFLAKIYRFIPYVRMVAICNSLSYSNASENSDIDFFVITKKGTIWLARLLMVLFVSILGWRPTAEKKRDMFCLSFFVDEDYLNVHSTMLNDDDIYYYYWLATLLPIYDPDGLYQKFLSANSWYCSRLPNAYSNQFSKLVSETRGSRYLSRIFGWLVWPPFLKNFLYRAYRRLQVKIIDRNLQSLVNVDTRVVVNDQMLKFYANDNRESYYKKWKHRLYTIFDKDKAVSAN